MRSLLCASQLSQEDIRELYRLYKSFKGGERKSLEGNAALLFLESSTRTRFSFQLACESLGLRTYYAGRRETSIEKGESFKDTLLTLKALGFKVVIFRVPFTIYPCNAYEDLGISLINAGDGSHEHPTQGLLDLFTLLDVFGTLEGLNILYVGDILHSRVRKLPSENALRQPGRVWTENAHTFGPHSLRCG